MQPDKAGPETRGQAGDPEVLLLLNTADGPGHPVWGASAPSCGCPATSHTKQVAKVHNQALMRTF